MWHPCSMSLSLSLSLPLSFGWSLRAPCHCLCRCLCLLAGHWSRSEQGKWCRFGRLMWHPCLVLEQKVATAIHTDTAILPFHYRHPPKELIRFNQQMFEVSNLKRADIQVDPIHTDLKGRLKYCCMSGLIWYFAFGVHLAIWIFNFGQWAWILDLFGKRIDVSVSEPKNAPRMNTYLLNAMTFQSFSLVCHLSISFASFS